MEKMNHLLNSDMKIETEAYNSIKELDNATYHREKHATTTMVSRNKFILGKPYEEDQLSNFLTKTQWT